jgi:hypothetical protein
VASYGSPELGMTNTCWPTSNMQIPPVHGLVASLIELVHLFFDFFRRE